MVKAGPRALPHLRVLPETRGECVDGCRPCPLVTCRHHLLVGDLVQFVNPSTRQPLRGVARVTFAYAFDEREEDVEAQRRGVHLAPRPTIADVLVMMPETCALDVAERGGATFDEIGTLLDVTYQSVEEVQVRALARIRDQGAEFEDPEHPEDSYLDYADMGADALAELAAELRKRAKKERER